MYQLYIKYFANVIFILTAGLSFTDAKDNVGRNPWEVTEISPVALYQIDYGSRRIEVRDHLRNHNQSVINRKTYYVSPLGELDPLSAVRKWNSITNEFEVRFAVRMWDDELIRTAWAYLKEHEEPRLPLSRVQLLPIQSVALRCSDCKEFGINGSPLRVSALPRRVHFSLTCETAEDGDRLVELMKSDPEYFQTLRLAFALQGQPLETNVITVQLDAALDGDLYTHIKRHLPSKAAAYLLPADEERLKRHFFQNLQAAYLWESSGIQDNYARQLKTGIHSFLVDSRHDSTSFGSVSWQHVYWQNKDGVMRPDLMALQLSTLSKSYDNTLIQDWFQDTPSTSSDSEDTQQAAAKEIMEMFKTENVTEFVGKAREFVRWNGTHFVPKTLLFTKINLFERIDPKRNGSFQMTVQFIPAALLRDVTIHVDDTLQEQTALKKQIIAITEFLETNFTKELKQIKVRLAENDQKKFFTTVHHEKAVGGISESARNVVVSTSDSQALKNMAGLLAHFHSTGYTANHPVWYSSSRTSLNDLINSLSPYGLVSYLPPPESVCGSIRTTRVNNSVVWDPVNSKLLYFDEKILHEFPTERSLYDHNHVLERLISTDAPWRNVLDMSFDWITRNLYILSSNNYFIFVLSIETPYSWTQLKCSQTNDAIERLIVDPTGGYLFWSTKSSLIRRSWLNGENATTIWDPEGSYSISPWSLTIDHETGNLFVVDSSEKTIVALDRDGNVLRTIPLKWANGEEANVFEKSQNLNKVPKGFIVMKPDRVFFIDLNTEIVHPIDVSVPSASRYVVFSSSPQSYPMTVNPCRRNSTGECVQTFRTNNYYHGDEECIERGFTETPCGNEVCLHNPLGEYSCH